MKVCYLFYGPDRGRQNVEVDRIRAELEKRTGGAAEQVSFYADQDSVETIIAHVRNGSLFNEHLFVLVHRSECFSASDAKQIQAYWERPNPSSTVIFLSEEYKEVKDRFKFVAKEDSQVFWEVGEGEKSAWIRNYLRRNQANIDNDALDLLCELVESDTLSMQRDCDTLLLVRQEGDITIADVESYIFHSRQENVFTLFETLLRKDFEASLAGFQKITLSQESEPIGVINGLQWQFRNFYSLKAVSGRGPARREQFEKLNIRNIKTQAAFNSALPSWNLRDIELSLKTLAVFDSQLRQSRPGVHVFLAECMIYQILVNQDFFRVFDADAFGIFDVSAR